MRIDPAYWDTYTYTNKENKKIRDGLEFENLVEHLLRVEFGKGWKATKKSHDHNRDFYLYNRPNRIWAECKNYKQSIALNTIAPTLVMAEIYEVSSILFFSFSKINKEARKKIFAYGNKTNKKIKIYDDVGLEELIIKHSNSLPKKYQPHLIDANNNITIPSISFFLFKDIFNDSINNQIDYIPLKKVKQINYNTPFRINIIIQNNCSKTNKFLITLKPSMNIYKYCLLNKADMNNYSKEITIDEYSGNMIELNFLPIHYQENLFLPEIIIQYNNKKIKSLKHKVKCVWSEETMLIGSEYQDIVHRDFVSCLDNNVLGVYVIHGKSGTGKTRLLKEFSNKLISYGYSILTFKGGKSTNSINVIKEIIYSVFDIPQIDIEDLLIKYDEIDFSTLGLSNKLYKIISKLSLCVNKNNFNTLVDEDFKFIFERMSNQKIGLIIDNLQFYDSLLVSFVNQYITYSLNRQRVNKNVLCISINQDYYSKYCNEFLSQIKILSHDFIHSIKEKEIFGFSNKKIALIFLRQLTNVNNEFYDYDFYNIIDKVGLNPLNLYQAIYYLIQSNVISDIYYNQAHISNIAKFRDKLEEMPKGLKNLVEKRWEYLHDKEDALLAIMSIIHIYIELDHRTIRKLSIESQNIDILLKYGFIKSEDDKYCFYHDLVENIFLLDNGQRFIEIFCEYILKYDRYDYIQNDKIANLIFILNKFYKLSSQQKEHIEKFIERNYFTSLPKKLSKFILTNLIEYIINDNLFTPSLRILYLHKIAGEIRDGLGSNLCLKFLAKINEYLEQLAINELSEAIIEYKNFINFYSDVLNHFGRINDAIDILTSSLYKVNDFDKESDSVLYFKSLMYNRLHTAYKKLNTNYGEKEKWKTLKCSRDIAAKIKDLNYRNEMEYMNYSDEGYCYYHAHVYKDQLINIWSKCMKYTPEIIPQKTLNYYRKKIQLSLIAHDFNVMDEAIGDAEFYLRNGKYSHEKLVFTTFFSLARLSSLMMLNPIAYKDDIQLLINRVIELEHLLQHGKLASIYQIKAITAHYAQLPKEVYYNCKEAYLLMVEDRLHDNQNQKFDLFLKNMIILFYLNNINNTKYDLTYIKDNNLYSIFNKDYFKDYINFYDYFSKYKAEGIFITPDKKFNLPLVN